LLYLFEDYALDPERRELRRGPDVMAVEPQVFDLLVYLVQQRDRVVSKDDLRAAVWAGRIVSESTMGSRINAARAAIGDSGEAQRLIRTLPRKGFRFVGAVLEELKPAAPIVETKADAVVSRSVEGSEAPAVEQAPTFMVPAGPDAGAVATTTGVWDGKVSRFAIYGRRHWVVGAGMLLVAAPLAAAITWATMPVHHGAGPQPEVGNLYDSLMRRVLSATLSGKITPADEGKRNYYRESPLQKALAACVDWGRSSPFRLEYRTFGFSQNNRQQKDADERALNNCYRSRPPNATCDCIIADRNDENALTLPPGWADAKQPAGR